MALQSSPISLVITVVNADGLSVKSVLKRKPNAFVQLTVGKFSPQKTPVVYGSSTPSWEASFPFVGVDMSSELSFKVIDKAFGHKTNLGSKILTIRELLELQRSSDVVILGLPTGNLSVHARQGADIPVTATALVLAQQAGDRITPLPVPEINSSVSQSLGEIVNSLSTLIGIADSFSQIHPYVHAAWQAVSLVYKVVKAQLDRDGKIISLVNSMETLYSFVNPLESFHGKHELLHKSLEDLIKRILKQTVECVLFIQEYAGHGFAGKAIRHVASTADARIDEFNKSFSDLGQCLDTGLGVQTTLISFRTHEGVEKLVIDNVLKPVEMDWSKRLLCQPKTRLDIVEFVIDWVANASGDKSNVLWLWGLAGCGKSTLSTSIAHLFAEIRRLGAFVFFDRDVKERSDPFSVVRTLACQLSMFDRRICHEVSLAIEDNPKIATMQLFTQYRDLLKQPLHADPTLSEEGPIVIVIDALDECGTDSDPERLLTLLAEETANLPPAIRIIITSRPEPDIKSAFLVQPHIHAKELPISPSNPDISIFIRDELAKIGRRRKVARDWPESQKVTALVGRTAGLFIWASTACKYIDGYRPPKRLNELLSGKVHQNAEAALDDLYTTALKNVDDWGDTDFRVDYSAILGLVIVAKDPLSPRAIDRFLSLESEAVIEQLGSILHWRGPTDPVRILHLSFRDFVSDKLRCGDGPWFIDLVDHNQRLAESCLTQLGLALGETFCQLGLGHPLPSKSQAIDEVVIYACTYWIVHVCEITKHCDTFGRSLYEFMSKHILHWLEAMSMLGRSRSTASLLEQLHTWSINLIPEDNDLHELAYDAYRFAGFFSNTIAEHPSLVYLSALPFAPTNSRIYQLFYHDGLPRVLGGFQKWWSPSLRVLQAENRISYKGVGSVAFSPDGRKIVSSGYRKIKVWDALTGMEVVPALEIDIGQSVVRFSPDGSRIWSGSDMGTIHILDPITGRPVRPVLRWDQWGLGLTVHRPHFNRVAFSLDGSRVAFGSGSRRGRLHIVDLVTGKEAYPALSVKPYPSQDHKGMHWSMEFSPDSSKLAFCSKEGTIHFLDIKTGREIGPTLEGHSRQVKALAFFPDGSKIISGSKDCSIRIWDLVTGQLVHQARVEHSEGLIPLAFSSDQLWMASASLDDVIQIWDTRTGERVGSVLEGHSDRARSIAFSPDCSRLVSGAYSDDIRIWDITSGRKSYSRLQRHIWVPESVAFSPDGLRIRSTDFDDARFWDTFTGRELKTEPYDCFAVFAPNSSNVVSSRLGEPILLVDVETDEEVRPNPETRISSGSILTCSGNGAIRARGRLVWRLPLELTCEASDVRGQFIAFALRNGQVFAVHLPDEVIP